MLSKLTHLFARGTEPETADDRIALWLVRLQQDDNPWLRAERLEQQGHLADARRLYLQDADRQRERGLRARVAVARAASAEITAQLGDQPLANWERQRAADDFRVHAERATR